MLCHVVVIVNSQTPLSVSGIWAVYQILCEQHLFCVAQAVPVRSTPYPVIVLLTLGGALISIEFGCLTLYPY